MKTFGPWRFLRSFPFPRFGIDKTLTSERCMPRVLPRPESSLIVSTTTPRLGAHRTLILSILNLNLVQFHSLKNIYIFFLIDQHDRTRRRWFHLTYGQHITGTVKHCMLNSIRMSRSGRTILSASTNTYLPAVRGGQHTTTTTTTDFPAVRGQLTTNK